MIAFGSQNQLQSSLAPFRDLLKALMFLSNLNGFKSPPLPPNQRFAQMKGSSKVWKEKGSKWFSQFFYLSLSPYGYALLVCFTFLFWVSLVLFFVCFFMFLFGCFSVFVFVLFIKIFFFFEKLEKYKNSMCILVLVYHRWPLKQSFLNFVSLVT